MQYPAERRTGAEMSSQRLALLLLAVVLALGVMLTPATLLAQETTYSASLSGSDHTPPITTDATGTFAATVDLATGAISYTLTVPSITAATAAHIHLGAAGESGPVVVPLFAAADGSVDSIDVSSTAGAADFVGPFAGDPLGFVTALLAGNLYVNVHTMANPPREIRGQIQPGGAGGGDVGFTGELPVSGFATVTFTGTIDELRTALLTACASGAPVFGSQVVAGVGSLIPFFSTTALSAPNAAFEAAFAGGLSGTPLIAGNCG